MPLLRLPSYPPLARRPGVHMERSAPPWFESVGDHGFDESRTQQREPSEVNTRASSVNGARRRIALGAKKNVARKKGLGALRPLTDRRVRRRASAARQQGSGPGAPGVGR